ncbi:LLM class flavin-dependent oxidoreductase [Kineosporia sp. NBRC 101731]|uniref:LLM class flavin-dependent oxidoreductase n=1 Tax=Kineosporia sp. NBRC 101731 TaxID=3032199 RepID=UPI0024A479DD|nr:LLM class flavin-dependent oxidoreductase [Kineosporia sp. NBRC 101731]GLY31020.1 5,10-methylenetetrahydromethanopterin reductase [Kineosporia sp. NBRC 101731]
MSELIFSARIGGHGVMSVVEKALLVEDAGFDQVWTGNDMFGEPGLVTLAAIAMKTSRIRFGSGVIDPVSLHPAQIAMFASGLQEISGDRFLLGLGAGSDVFFRWAGLEPAKPVVRTREAVLAIRELTNGRSPAGVPGTGDLWTENAKLRSHRPVPIYIGAMGPKMIDLTGKIADGALPLCLPPRHVYGVVEQLKAGAAKTGRTIDDLDVAACVWASISDDRDEARTLMARHIALYSGSLSTDALAANGLDPQEFARTQELMLAGREDDAVASVTDTMLELGIVGGVDEVIEQCAQLIDAGVKHISFGPPMGPDPVSAVRLIGSQVLPALRELV